MQDSPTDRNVWTSRTSGDHNNIISCETLCVMLLLGRDSHIVKGQCRNSRIKSLHYVGESDKEPLMLSPNERRWRRSEAGGEGRVAVSVRCRSDSLFRELLSRWIVWETTEVRKEENSEGRENGQGGKYAFLYRCFAYFFIFFFAACFLKGALRTRAECEVTSITAASSKTRGQKPGP